MDSKEKHKLTQRDQSTKDLFLSSGNTVRTSKSDEPVANAHPPKDKSNSIKSDKDVRFAAPPATTPQDTKDSNKSEKGSKEMLERQDSRLTMGSPKVPRKYFTNWRQACDKTKDRTKELLKRWRTLPETEGPVGDDESQIAAEDKDKSHGWSVHVWSMY